MPDLTDLRVIMILTFKDEMVSLGIIPENVKWDELTEEQINNVHQFLVNKLETKGGSDDGIINNS